MDAPTISEIAKSPALWLFGSAAVLSAWANWNNSRAKLMLAKHQVRAASPRPSQKSIAPAPETSQPRYRAAKDQKEATSETQTRVRRDLLRMALAILDLFIVIYAPLMFFVVYHGSEEVLTVGTAAFIAAIAAMFTASMVRATEDSRF